MNWISESQSSWNWLQWMREVTDEDVSPASSLRELVRGIGQWHDAMATDRHATGDPERIANNEHFLYAASMMSRAARTAIEDALRHAVTWGVDEPMSWSSLPAEAKQHWAAAHHVVTTVLRAWVMLWHDLAAFQDRLSGPSQQDLLDQWTALADQAAQTIAGTATAAWAQRR